MTAKEKANELIEKMKPYMYCYMGSGMLTNTYDEDVANNFAKRCALITVEEVIDTESKNWLSAKREDLIGFWKDVKTELEALP